MTAVDEGGARAPGGRARSDTADVGAGAELVHGGGVLASLAQVQARGQLG